jgi:hypothetical protein
MIRQCRTQSQNVSAHKTKKKKTLPTLATYVEGAPFKMSNSQLNAALVTTFL